MSIQGPVTARDILADGADSTTISGQQLRKGTVAAFIANARAYEAAGPDGSDAEPLRKALVAAVPLLRTIGVLDVFAPRSPELRALIDGVE